MKGVSLKPFKAFWPILAAYFLFIFTLQVRAEAVKSLPKPTDYVSDYAHVLSAGAIARIDGICRQLDRPPANAQIAVVTVQTLDGEDTAQYATDLYHQMGIGKKGDDRGALVLLAVKDHKRWITTGYGLEGILNDAKVGDIGRAMVPLLRQNNYDGAVTLAVASVGQEIAADDHITLQDQPQMVQHRQQHGGGIPIGGIILLILLLVFFGGSPLLRMLLGYSILTSGMRGGGGGFGGGDSGGGGAGGSW